MAEKIILGRGIKQQFVDMKRRYGGSVLHPNYVDKTARMTTNGVDESILIYGEFGETICNLAKGRKSISVQEIYEKVKDLD